ncbi:MAG: YkgJ family cysteine cluster protein [Pseudomonadota bacterium]
MNEELCESVLSFLAGAEMAALRFGRDAGLACPTGCGDCCRDDRPGDSVLAALPAAAWAIGEDLVDLLAAAVKEPSGVCVFYDGDAAKHCRVYPLRPLVCRLFGFAGRHDKYGNIDFRPCRRMKGAAESPGSAVPPVFSDLALQLEGFYPPLGRERRPLNIAFHEAAQWLLLRKQYSTVGSKPGTRPLRIGRAAPPQSSLRRKALS